ncbi:MAG: acylneuraminate cytidylyltransferase [Nitrospirae bacterium]|nr:MAG: acylneuraminate cytidylyltransferase [Nitrospirota bacterium]
MHGRINSAVIVAIIQARTGSSRLPNKVLLKIKDKTLLELYVNRVRKSRLIDKIVIATTENAGDNSIEELAKHIGIDCFRGSENDLLDRYYRCAKKYHADVVVRATPDDPFVDHEIIDRAITIFKDSSVDFVNNHFEPTFPEGLDIEVYSIEALEKAWGEARLLSEREHVFPYFQNHPEEFKIIVFKQAKDYSYLRWTIDYMCDYEMTRTVYDYLYEKNPVFLQDDILRLLETHPEIMRMNNHIKRKEGVNKSKAGDEAMI